MASSITKNAQTAVNFFKSKGWSDAQAAGIVGNLQAESGIDLNFKATNGKAYGIAQWLVADRKAAFQQVYGIPLSQSTFQQQLDFVNWELNNTFKSAGTALKATNTASGAATVVFNQYEIPLDNSLPKRITFAQTLSGGVPEGVLGGGGTPAEKAPEDIRPSGFFLVNNAPPIPNRLHQYSTYIYALSLHLLDEKTYNDLTTTEKYTPKNVLIASAGRYSDTFVRNRHFNEDFYFGECDILTTISPNDYSRNSNAVTVDFTIIEPYGFTLVERIIAAAEDVNSKNYLMMPYLLQLDFFAVDDAGNLVGAIPELQKRIPITILTMDVNITEKGAEYSIKATSYNQEAFKTSALTVPINIEVTAKSVADFFQSIEGTADDKFTQDLLASETLQQRLREDPAIAAGNNVSPLLYNSKGAKSSVNFESLGAALNTYWKAQVDNKKAEIGDVYRFEFLPDPDTGQDVIGSATFVDPNKNTPKQTPMKKNDQNKDNITMRLSDTGDNQNIYDISKGIFSINFGTAIDRILEYVIRNSSYIAEQLVIPDGASQQEYQAQKEKFKDKPLKWFRITSRVRLIGYDNIRKCFAKEITYSVRPYKMYNIRSDLAPQGVAVNPVKNYNYIFTGKNDDIISLDIKFNFTYFDQQTADRSNLVQTSPIANSYNEEYYFQNAPNYTGGDPPKGANYNSVMPLAMKPVVRNTKSTSSGNPSDVREIAAADLAESLMSNTAEDMVVVYLSILGDPDFIKQDEIYYLNSNPTEQAVQTTIDPRLLPNGGSLIMDDGGVYVQVLFKIPRDIDDSTGFMKYDAEERNSVFSGLYIVNTVKSQFSQGKFTQELELIRLARQIAFDYVGSNNNTTTERPLESTVPGTLGITVQPPVIPSVLVSGGSPAPSTADAADTVLDQTAGQDQKVAQINNAEQPTETPEQRDLKAIRDNAPTTTISEQNQTPAIPSPQAPSEGKLALQQEYRNLQNQNVDVRNASAAADRQVDELQSQIDIAQGNIERAQARLANPELASAAQQSLSSNQQRLAALQSQLTSAKQTQTSAQLALDSALAQERAVQQKINQAV